MRQIGYNEKDMHEMDLLAVSEPINPKPSSYANRLEAYGNEERGRVVQSRSGGDSIPSRTAPQIRQIHKALKQADRAKAQSMAGGYARSKAPGATPSTPSSSSYARDDTRSRSPKGDSKGKKTYTAKEWRDYEYYEVRDEHGYSRYDWDNYRSEQYYSYKKQRGNK